MAWEAPDAPRLLISASRVAAELDVPAWKAWEVCWCLERRYYSEGQSHYRVTVRSLDSLRALLSLGLTLSDARTVMWHYKQEGQLPSPEMTEHQIQSIIWLRGRRRRGHVIGG